ncbi:sulfite exporter TauE/SafE family protein [Pigmentiphaga litoralis]|uniref:sulfite exporter TauE/SafE family protein n=1 Tax=Pigmentiphaga litoralis TaxID=516702 RepID=UPI003B438253
MSTSLSSLLAVLLSPVGIATVAIFTLAGCVKGVVGLGLPTVAMGLLALVMPPAQAAALLIIPAFLTNVWQALPWRSAWRVLRRLAGMQAGVCLGTWLTAWKWGAPSGAGAAYLLGGALMAYGAWGLLARPRQLSRQAERWVGPLAGAATGAIAAITGVFVIPAVPYLQSLGLARDELVRAMAISFMISVAALGVVLTRSADMSSGVAAVSALLLLPALAGMVIGQRIRDMLSPVVFRRCFLGSLILLGAYMVGAQAIRG